MQLNQNRREIVYSTDKDLFHDPTASTVESRQQKKRAVVNGFTGKFNLRFRIKEIDETEVKKILKANLKEDRYTITKCEFLFFKRITLLDVNVREAETIRVLFKQIKMFQ